MKNQVLYYLNIAGKYDIFSHKYAKNRENATTQAYFLKIILLLGLIF